MQRCLIMRMVIIPAATLLPSSVIAQASLPYTPPAPYFTRNLIALSFLQSSSSDWAQGAQNFIAAKASLRRRVVDTLGPLRVMQTVALDLGVRQTSDSADIAKIRTGENELFAEARIAWPRGWPVDPFISASLRTAITESFLYFAHPVRTASWWDPVVSFEAAGVQCVQVTTSGIFTMRGGVALKQTRANDNTLLTDNFRTPEIERYKAETGMEFGGEAIMTKDSALNYAGQLILFTTFRNPDIWSIRWSNELRYRIWKFFGITIQLQVVYDESQISHLQYKQGAMVSFFAER